MSVRNEAFNRYLIRNGLKGAPKPKRSHHKKPIHLPGSTAEAHRTAQKKVAGLGMMPPKAEGARCDADGFPIDWGYKNYASKMCAPQVDDVVDLGVRDRNRTVEAFISDIHFPFEDPRAWRLAKKMLLAIDPTIIFLGGDIVDNYAVSHFNRKAERVVKLQEEFDRTTEELCILRSEHPKAEMLYLPGNHEWRMDTFKSHVIELAGLRNLELPKLLHFKQLNITGLERYQEFQIGYLYHFHGDEQEGGSIYPARGVYLKQMGNQIFGHYHKAQVFYNRLMGGTVHVSWANPCLCLLKQEYIKSVSQWQQGFSVIQYYEDGLFHVDQVVFFEQDNGELCGIYRDETFTEQ